MRRFWLPVVVLAIGSLAWLPARAETKNVAIQDFDFSPSSVTLNPHGSVHWSYALSGQSVHTVTSDDGHSFDSGNIAPGQSYDFTFDTPGTYAYHCTNHPDMTGMVHVTGATPSSTPSASHTPTPAASRSATPKQTPKASVTPSASPSHAPSTTPSALASPSTSASADASPSTTGSPLAPDEKPASSGSNPWPLAAGAIVVLGGAGAFVYLRFIRS